LPIETKTNAHFQRMACEVFVLYLYLYGSMEMVQQKTGNS